MAALAHNFGPECTLQPAINPFMRRASEISNDAPTIRAQFFYSSDLPIDDPLSPIPPPTTSSGNGPSRVPPRPFSVHDNIALEEAWQVLQKAQPERFEDKNLGLEADDAGKYRVLKALSSLGGNEPPSSAAVDNLTKIIREAHHRRSVLLEHKRSTSQADQGEEGKTVLFAGDPAFGKDCPTQQDSGFGEDSSKKQSATAKAIPSGDPHLTICDNPDHIPFDHAMPVGTDEIGNEEFESGMSRRHRSPFRKREKPSRSSLKRKSKENIYGASPSERDTTGTPFLRVSERLKRARSRSSNRVSTRNQTDGADSPRGSEYAADVRARSLEETIATENLESNAALPSKGQHSRDRAMDEKSTTVSIPVGISRLHMVEMPDLKMGPIYWDPVHDVSSVMRGTWFYKDTMLPVEPQIANQLEEGYEYIKPWTLTYQDELKSCLEVGPEAELKITHRLWPPVESNSSDSRPTTSRSKLILLNTDNAKLEPDQQERKKAIIIAANPENRAAGMLANQTLDSEGKPIRLYAKSSVIYSNAKDAQILRPSQIPNAARGRKPLASIRKGRAIGIPVVRGFDQKAWDKVNPPSKRQQSAAKAREVAEAMRTASAAGIRRKSCGACLSEIVRPRVTDLVLVIHGIGQKLSERVESFHFTHAINAFRRRMNMELEAEAVKPLLREDLGSVMVLPVNWRSTMQLEDGGPDPDPNRRDADSSKNQFTLKDITAESIPAVRNLISDVMLDIPYYLSHHKGKMIEAVVKEANRIYRLWIKHNPGFEDYGRIHLIAHSLGSVMALDILSNQPTKIPKQIDVTTPPSESEFEFDTTNLFLCGSPAGFFMLLNKAPLIPRKGRYKPDADGDNASADVAGEAGMYGCLAVNNLYNVMHYNDPIAYRLNACLDVDYAAALQPASVPSASASWMQSFGAVFRSKPVAAFNPASADFAIRPSVTKLPSTVELETHNFSKEEIAEKRMYLLNDNGQIDYTLHSGGGPLEIQYLNMLSAHSSYWVLQDFVRFIVVEIGRKEGRGETIGAMRAVKKRGKPLLISPLTIPLCRQWDSSYDDSSRSVRPFSPSELYRHRSSTGILSACRQLYTLGWPLYYRENHFAISIRSLRRFVVDFPQERLSAIRSFEIRFNTRFADWPLWPLLKGMKGLERLIFDPPAMQQWNGVSGMEYRVGVVPQLVGRAGHRGLGDVVRNCDPAAVAAVSVEEEAASREEMTEVFMRCMPRLTGFWIIRRTRSGDRYNAESAETRERNHRDVEAVAIDLIHRRESEKGGTCQCKHTAEGAFCCQDCPLRQWELEGKYAPMEAEMRRWKPPEPEPWDETSAFGITSYEPFLEDEENAWGTENTRIMRRLYETSHS